ncbi:hypothetical protein ACE6H2_012496 [Prunus campanulata]
MKEGNGDDLSPEYIPEDESSKFKEDDGCSGVESRESLGGIQDDKNGNATSTAEEKSLPKEEPSELKVSDVELYFNEEIQNESSNEVHEEERSSLIGVPKVEPREEGGFSRSQDATINREHLKNEANETNETTKNEVSNEQKHLEVAISDSRAEERWCETTIEANETRKNEVSNEEVR